MPGFTFIHFEFIFREREINPQQDKFLLPAAGYMVQIVHRACISGYRRNIDKRFFVTCTLGLWAFTPKKSVMVVHEF